MAEIYQPIPETWPVAPEQAAQSRKAPTFRKGATIGLVNDGKLPPTIVDALERSLLAHGAGRILRFAQYYLNGEPLEELISEVERLVDTALVGLGN